MPTLTFKPSDVLVARFDGFGAQYNQNLFAKRSRDAGVTEAGVNVMKPKLAALGPQLARLFFHDDAFDDNDLLTSFRNSVTLAQDTLADGGTIKGFAAELVHLVNDAKIDKLRWVTLRNEPNGSSPMDKNLYAQVWGDLDAALAQTSDVRSRLHFMGGDLLLNNQKAWFEFMAQTMPNLFDAYSIHVYWDYRTPAKIDERLQGVRQIVNGLGDAKRPLYVMEYGARGIMADGEDAPGHTQDGKPVADTNRNAFQRSWFALASIKQGFRGVVSWDAYFAMYDNKPQHYSLIGPPEDWARKPAFRAHRLLIGAVRPGWKGVNVDGVSDSERVVGFTDGERKVTVAGLDTRGAQQEGASGQQAAYTIAGLPANTQFGLWFWNHDGDGMNSFDGRVGSDAQGRVSFEAPLQSVFVVTTLPAPS